MSNIVYMTTNVKPSDEIVLAIGYHQLVAAVPKEEVVAQAYRAGAPREGDMWRCAAFRLTDTGINIFRHGIVGPPRGFQEWPEGLEEPDWDRYPIRSELALR
jgi:hypothetical protein